MVILCKVMLTPMKKSIFWLDSCFIFLESTLFLISSWANFYEFHAQLLILEKQAIII